MKLLVTIAQERLNRNDGRALQFWVTCAFRQLQEDRFTRQVKQDRVRFKSQ
jgi:hypothetical protein